MAYRISQMACRERPARIRLAMVQVVPGGSRDTIKN
jgi:hypothetical protein